MKSVSSLISNNSNSPKTPGGISKSLLTPCRRVGLSRNWKKRGPSSPFISPLTTDGIQVKTEEKNVDTTTNDLSVNKTPTRNVALLRKRKSKILLPTISPNESYTDTQNQNLFSENNEKLPVDSAVQNKPENVDAKAGIGKVINISPTRVKSQNRSKKVLSHVQTSTHDSKAVEKNCDAKDLYIKNKEVNENIDIGLTLNSKDKSPNELKKKCIVVIQRKIFMDVNETNQELIDNSNTIAKEVQGTSQTLFDSDPDDMPLCQLNKSYSQKSQSNEGSQRTLEKITITEDDDFIEHKSKIRKVDTATFNINLINNSKKKKHEASKILKIDKAEVFDDDEDFDFDNKRTILLRKTYEKVTKPLKAKSTGMITQKDIDELKARIEAKKKLLLTKTISEDTRELRELIKKWQKGCQDALMELMDLMKKKFPEKSNMDYSQILETLHIPAALVGYDSDNDCFHTPDDASIILSNVDCS